MLFTIEITGEDEDEVYEELMMCIEDMRDSGRKFQYDVLAVDVPLRGEDK